MTNHTEQSSFSIFLQLEKEVRAAKDVRSLAFIISNLSRRILPYIQSVVWKKQILGISVIAVSATSAINAKSPYIVWLQRILIPWIIEKYSDDTVIVLKKEAPKTMLVDWGNYLTDSVVFCRFKNFSGDKIEAGVIFMNPEPWQESQLHLVNELRLLYEHAWQLVAKPEKKKFFLTFWSQQKKRNIIIGIIVFLFLIFLIPVRQTVLAPAEIAPKNPILVTSSIEGIIQSVEVQPNQTVKKNQILFMLDKITLENKVEAAQQALAVAEEKYRRAYQDAYKNPKSKDELTLLEQDVAKAKNELVYTKLLLDRSDIRAEKDGIVIFSSPKDWLGKPIKVGEQVMLLAPEDQKKLDIEIPQADMIQIQPGNKVNFFADINPLHALSAKVDYASFVATPSSDNKLNYYISANFDANQALPRYGAHGTAKLYGHRVTLFFYLFKRPIIYLQSKLGI